MKALNRRREVGDKYDQRAYTADYHENIYSSILLFFLLARFHAVCRRRRLGQIGMSSAGIIYATGQALSR